MAESPTKPASPFVWHELNTPNPAKSRQFYTGLLGWTAHEQPMGELGNYTLLKKDGEVIGGMLPPHGPECGEMPPHWSIYIHVDDVDASAKKAEELGGKICVPPFDIPNIGRTCVITDPTGAAFYLFQPAMAQQSAA